MIDALAYWLTTYWLYLALALVIGLMTGWFSYSPSDENEGAD